MDSNANVELTTLLDSNVKNPLVLVPKKAADLWRHRELLLTLIKKELKIKYKNSVLGFAWSMLNPLPVLIVFP